MLQKKIFNFLIKHEDNKILHAFLHKFSNNGFVIDEPSEKDYQFGYVDTPKEVLQEDGQWLKFLPEDEQQRKGSMDPMYCVSESETNDIEMVILRKYGIRINLSQRQLAKSSNTRANGNTMRKVGDATWNIGICEEKDWPFSNDIKTWNEFYKNIPVDILGKAKKLLSRDQGEYQFTYEAVDASSKRNLMEALKYSPLWVAGYAWMKSGNLYHGKNYANHCFTIVGYVEGSHWIAYDSYSPYVKNLSWDFPLYFPKVITVTYKNEEEEKKAKARMERKKIIDRGFKYVMRADFLNGGHGEVYKITLDGLEEMTDNEKVQEGFKALAEKGENTGITEKLFKSLI